MKPSCIKHDYWNSSVPCHACRDEELTKLREENARLKEEHAIWEKHGLVQLVKENERLKNRTERGDLWNEYTRIHTELIAARAVIEAAREFSKPACDCGMCWICEIRKVIAAYDEANKREG